MKFILRNLLNSFRRFKLAVALNILGLSIAFAMFIIIAIQLNYDFRFDRHHENYDKIFRLEWYSSGDGGGTGSANLLFGRPEVEHLFGASPHIVAGAFAGRFYANISLHTQDDDAKSSNARFLHVSPSFFDVFTFDFVEGSATGIVIPESIIIPLSLSCQLFGRESAVGRRVVCDDRGVMTVRAVYRDLPTNSTIRNYVYTVITPDDRRTIIAYFRVNNAANIPIVLEQMNNADVGFFTAGSAQFLRSTALRDIRFLTDVFDDPAPKAGIATRMLLILLAIAAGVIAIATINFTNFNMALMPMRVKNINTQRIMGAQRNMVRLAIVVETLFFFLFAWLVALLFVLYFQTTPLANFLDADMSLTVNLLVVGGTALVALLAGLLVGLYPSYYLTSFQPALSLTGNFGLSPKGKLMRNGLIGVQFVASLTLIIVVSFMFLQNRFMQNTPLGFNTERLMTVSIARIRDHRDAFTHQVQSHASVEAITFNMRVLSSASDLVITTLEREYRGEPFSFRVFDVHYTFPSVMGIEITEGRDFRREDVGVPGSALLFNETARKKYNLQVGSRFLMFSDLGGDTEIIGFMSDIKTTSFHTEVSPMAFQVGRDRYWQAYIRVRDGTDKNELASYIQNIIRELDTHYAGWVTPVRSFDEVIREQYENEIALNRLIGLFSLLAIFISIAGVFALVVFDSECRQREVGIRKVNGASTADILLMFNKKFVGILATSFVIAVPIGWIVVSRWMENFAYRTPMYWWVHVLAFVIVAMLTIGTVTFQNWRVANENPVKLIRK